MGVANRLGVSAQIFSSPTMLMAAIGTPARQQTFMLRVEPGDVDLGKLARVDRVAVEVIAGELSPGEGSHRIAAVVGGRPRYGGLAQVPAWSLASACVAIFLGGQIVDAGAAAVIGLAVGILSALLGRREAQARLFELCAAFVAAFGARAAAATLDAGISAQITLLAGLIVLLPGLTLTTAMTELATRNLVSGTARLTAAVIVFLELAFGVAIGDRLATAWLGAGPATITLPLPGWILPPALLFSALGLVVLFRAERRQIPWIVASCFIAFYGARLGSSLLTATLGASVGAFAAAVFSNLYARSGRGPALVPMVPGLLLLVPGSLGFRSLSSMLQTDVVRGIDTAFSMILVAVSIVAGLLFANVALPPRREL